MKILKLRSPRDS